MLGGSKAPIFACSSHSPSITLVLVKKKKKKSSPHIRTCSSIDKMTYYPSLHTSLSLPRFIKLLTSPQNGWHSSSLSLVLCSDLEREMKQWWGSHNCCSTTPRLSPTKKKKKHHQDGSHFPSWRKEGVKSPLHIYFNQNRIRVTFCAPFPPLLKVGDEISSCLMVIGFAESHCSIYSFHKLP